MSRGGGVHEARFGISSGGTSPASRAQPCTTTPIIGHRGRGGMQGTVSGDPFITRMRAVSMRGIAGRSTARFPMISAKVSALGGRSRSSGGIGITRSRQRGGGGWHRSSMTPHPSRISMVSVTTSGGLPPLYLTWVDSRVATPSMGSRPVRSGDGNGGGTGTPVSTAIPPSITLGSISNVSISVSGGHVGVSLIRVSVAAEAVGVTSGGTVFGNGHGDYSSSPLHGCTTAS